MSPDWITIVSGLPRSGTSLMMQMLAVGGMSILADDRRPADEDNPRGYYELEAVKHTRTDRSWLPSAPGKAVKVIHLLLPELPENQPCRVIFMQRDLQEVIRSQRAMLQRQGRPLATIPDEKLIAIFAKQLADVRHWLAQRPAFQVLNISHRAVIEEPRKVAERVSTFLDAGLDVDRMAAAVHHDLYRQRVT